MHLYDAIEEYNFTHGKHFDSATGQYDLLMPHDLGRPLTHEEMDYNFLYQKQTMNGFRIFGSGANYKLNADDLDKVLKFHKISPSDEDYAIYTGAGYVDDQYIWIPVEMAAAAQPAYVTLTANPTTINETGNSTVTYTLNVVNVEDGTTIDWSIATGNGITASDFVGGLTGTATINGNTATWTVQAAADNFTEGAESFTLTLATTDSAGNDTTTMSQDPQGNGGVPLSATVAISDSSYTPQYNSISSANSVNEGASITFTVNTSYFFQAATADWLVDFANSTATSADFTGATTGTVNLDANGDGTFSVAIASDLINDNENFTVKLTGLDSNGINTNEISKTVTINNASFPTYTTFTGPATRLEGQNAQYALQGTNIPNGTQVGYTISSTNPDFTVDDISLNSLTGFITMNSNFGQLFFGISEDYTVESDETFTVTLNTQDSAGNTTGLPMNVQTVISDVAPTYQILGQNSITEGQTQSYTFRASNMTPGTTVYWELRNYGNSNSYTEFADDLSTPRTGSGQVQTVGNNVELDFDITAVNDMASSEGENFKIVVWDDASNYATGPNFDGAVSGALATKDITITDQNPQWTITAQNNQAEPETITFTVNTRYVMAGQTYTWAASANGSNPASGADFQGGSFPSGSGTVSTFNNTLSPSGTFTTEVIADNTTEHTEQYKIELSDQNGNVVATKVINITDDSQQPNEEIHWLHWSSNAGYPSGASLIVEPSGGWYLNNNTQTSDFSAVWADMVANQGTANNVPVIETFQMLGSGLTQSSIPNGTIGFDAIGAANRYYIAIPQSISGDPSSTALFQLPDSANADITFSGRMAFSISGVEYWLYDVGLTASVDALNLNLKNA